MTIELTQEQERLIEQELATGHFSDRGEVIAEALVLLKRQGEIRAKVQVEVQQGLDSLDAGRSRTIRNPEDAQAFATELKQQVRERQAQRERNAP